MGRKIGMGSYGPVHPNECQSGQLVRQIELPTAMQERAWATFLLATSSLPQIQVTVPSLRENS